MSIVLASQFGLPRGLRGRLVGRLMARFNRDFNRWAVQEVGRRGPQAIGRIVELGPGPGIGLEEALRVFPEAQVWGVDPSAAMLSQSRRRNAPHVDSGRMTLLQGGVASLAELAPVDLVIAVHVLYFWHRPAEELAQLHSFLRPGGRLALGYQLRQNMPAMAQKHFPRQGHVLYDSDDGVRGLLSEAGFREVAFIVKGSPDAPHGRLALATA